MNNYVEKILTKRSCTILSHILLSQYFPRHTKENHEETRLRYWASGPCYEPKSCSYFSESSRKTFVKIRISPCWEVTYAQCTELGNGCHGYILNLILFQLAVQGSRQPLLVICSGSRLFNICGFWENYTTCAIKEEMQFKIIGIWGPSSSMVTI